MFISKKDYEELQEKAFRMESLIFKLIDEVEGIKKENKKDEYFG